MGEHTALGNGLAPSEALKVVIIGAGIAGLTAAVGLRRQGHQVHVYEQSQLADEIGAAIHISPNANSILLRLGVDIAERGATRLLQTRYYDASCRLLSIDDNEAQSHRWQAGWRHAHRGHLHSQLKDRATSQQHEGPPARIYTSSRIVEVDPQHAQITLATGEVVQGDVLVGADGVRSVARRALFGSEYDSFEIGKNAFRFMVPRADILADPETRELGEAMGSLDMFFAQEHKIIMYPCVNDTLINIVCIHPSRQSTASAETYNKGVSKDKLLEIFHDFPRKLLKVFEKCDGDTLKVYPLFDAKNVPTFVQDRLALIGDAAHPFTPFIGQGGATAIEDAVSLGVLLSRGTTLAEVPERLQLYNKARYERATKIQGYSRMAGGDGVKPGEENAARMKGREHAFYALSHDEFHASEQVLREHEWSKINGATWRQPTVFGPMPGPGRDGMVHSSSTPVKAVTATITFKTSGTLLRNLLPSSSYSLAAKDTVALASLTTQSYREVEWLGSTHAFNRVSLQIHGVQYTQADGSLVTGRYTPVMFGDSADVVIAEREELGYPIVFSEIEPSDQDGSYCINLSWKNTRWASVWLKDLRSKSTTLGPLHAGVSVHRCTPQATEKPARGGADIAPGILLVEDTLPSDSKQVTNGTTTADKGPSYRGSTNAGFQLTPHTRLELPTLHHIVSRMCELPVFGVVDATVCEEGGLKTW